ncbi:CDP-diacylglycerol--glycerol-3-phosphate 3-phosphatidyltransferase [Leeia aquatica]|uniref:CDP-diacylglycerol--glycerol-3-phosphate 3-phosphatidyltransferase n=1 Tax=Leeia aquatica TaxID=2725557 RepID=A0A847S3T0_9NEIS|nr:CDP-diacylglycerol--glycerol-3-phosphate 3-phosphatidyltransferase [Leeia aquatica]NLR74414.1 CDP-diacylglycerol--glycerol-3-phosphate 3-phosphatidyltransferase [Leeia aquatica]
MTLNLPTLLTWLRIILIPLFMGIYYLPLTMLSMPDKNLLATGFFVLAAVTDWLDGYLARALNQTSAFGAFLDPVADKLMVAAALVMLVQLDRADPALAAIIIGREITISALREWMAELGARKSVAVSYVGKLKTAAQMAAITALLYDLPLIPGLATRLAGEWLLVIAVVLTLWSMVYYLRQAWPLLTGRAGR